MWVSSGYEYMRLFVLSMALALFACTAVPVTPPSSAPSLPTVSLPAGQNTPARPQTPQASEQGQSNQQTESTTEHSQSNQKAPGQQPVSKASEQSTSGPQASSYGQYEQLEEHFKESLSAADSALSRQKRQTQEKLQQQVNPEGEQAGIPADGKHSDNQGKTPPLSRVPDNNSVQSTGNNAGGHRTSGSSAGSAPPNPLIPEDVGSGRHDDIIARQLREAAMKVADPELREKLWDEYRKYKKIK